MQVNSKSFLGNSRGSNSARGDALKSEESNGCLMIRVGVVGRADERSIGNSTATGLAACQKLRIIQCEAVSDERLLYRVMLAL